MTAQEIFDTVQTHLLGMKRRSMLDARSCAYRGKCGAICAVGVLLSDGEARGAEGLGVDGLNEKLLLPDRLIPHVRFLECLQEFHDEKTNWNTRGLTAIAKRDLAALNPSVQS